MFMKKLIRKILYKLFKDKLLVIYNQKIISGALLRHCKGSKADLEKEAKRTMKLEIAEHLVSSGAIEFTESRDGRNGDILIRAKLTYF